MHSLLFVDDEKAILKSLMRLFFRRGLVLFFAEDGEEALKIMSENHVDMVVSDMRMPKMDGHKLLKEVQRLYPHTIRFILSGHTDEREIYKAVLDGSAKMYLLKPWEPEKLFNFIMGTFELLDILQEKKIINLADKLKYLAIQQSVQRKLYQFMDKEENTSKLVEAIENDLGATARVLKFVNSSYFDIKVGSVKQAVAYLGSNIVKVILSNGEDFLKEESYDVGQGNYSILQEQGNLTKRISEILFNKILKKEFSEVAASAGLLHNIGLVLKGNQEIDDFCTIKDKTSSVFDDNMEATHEEIGGYILKWWGIPEAIYESALFHHSPLLASPANQELVCAIHLADYHAWKKLGRETPKLDNRIFELLEIDQDKYEAIIIEGLNVEDSQEFDK